MDLDVLLYGDAVGEFGRLKLPRPSLLDWGFMLGPMAEIAPDLLHPVALRTMAALWQDFDQGGNPLLPVALDLAGA
jgi:2-amino-4-hydroxy-6-hydroxymethyldihydropteridine diphosphokinase